MTTQSPAISSSTDLVLQLAGGNRNGQLLPISTAKCLLSSLITNKAEAENYRCAIFRGEKGVAFRSYSELVLVNGNKTSVQWLKVGDTIQLTPDLKVIVKQLGTFASTKATNGPNTSKVPVAASRKSAGTLVMGSEASVDHRSPSQQLNVPVPVARETPAADPHAGQRVDVLNDQLTSLVDAASQSGTLSPVTAEPLSDNKMADAPSSIQDYLNKALAPTEAGTEASKPMAQAPVVAPTMPAVPATPAVRQDGSQVRKEEVANSLNRLLGGSEQSPSLGQGRPSASQSTTSEAGELPSTNVESVVTTPVAAAPVAGAHPAKATSDTPKAQPTEFLKSLGIDPEELGLSGKIPNQERTTSELPETVTPRENTSSAALPTANEIIASASMGAGVDTGSDSAVIDEVEAALVAPEPAATKKAESVADVLARMQNAGSLDSFSMDGPNEENSVGPNNSPAEVTPPNPKVQETVVAESFSEGGPATDEDNSVEDYMSQLLNRMRGGEDSEVEDEKPAVETSKDSSDAPEEAPAETEIVEAPKVELPQEKLTAEQFVPQEKAVRMKSFDSLREIANNSNRLAIQDHLANQRKVSTQTKMQLAFISLGFGVLFFLMSWVLSSEVNSGGVFCGIVFLICGVGFAKFYRDEHQLDESIIKAQKDKA